jgi:long-subunit acyl-CoA synthetase (AMP-forming)
MGKHDLLQLSNSSHQLAKEQILLIDIKKALDKTQHESIRTLRKLRIKGNSSTCENLQLTSSLMVKNEVLSHYYQEQIKDVLSHHYYPTSHRKSKLISKTTGVKHPENHKVLQQDCSMQD